MISIIYILVSLFSSGILSPAVILLFVIVDVVAIESTRSLFFENFVDSN